MKKLFITLILLSHQLLLMAQIVPQIMIDARQDGQKIFTAYLTPYLARTGVALNRNWSATAQPKKLWTFDFSVKLSVVQADEKSRTYDINALGLEVLKTTPGSSSIASTLMGNMSNDPILEVWKKESQFTIFNPDLRIHETITDPARAIQGVNKIGLPKGSLSKWVNGEMAGIIPFTQINAGIPFNTELSVRYTPKINTEDITYSTIGIGVKHDLMQWILKDFSGNTVDKKSAIGISLILGYTRVKGDYKKPGITLGISGSNDINSDYTNTQHVSTNFSAINAELIFSKKYLNFLSPFVSAGYGKSTVEVNILGKYPVNGVQVGSQTDATINKLNEARILIENNRYIYTDPITFNLIQNDIKGSVGFQAEIARALSFSASATYGKFRSYSASFSIMTDRLFNKYDN